MTNSEFYYLVLVCAAFGSFGLSLGAAYLRYRAWAPREARIASRP